MVERISKRFLSLTLVAVMLLSLLPAFALPAFAATSGTLTGLSDANIGLNFSGTADNAWSATGTTITGSVVSTGGTCSDTSYNSTLTIKNNKATKATLSFNYAIEQNKGTITVDGNKVASNGNFSKELAAGTSITVKIESGSTTATKITMTDVALVSDVTATTTFVPAENGTYTVDGKTVKEEYSNTQSSMTAYQVVASPAEGYQFLGWYNLTTGKCIATAASTALNIESDCTVTAKFASKAVALFETGGQRFADLNEAVAYAQANSQSKITLATDGSISGTYTIPAGITLLIPFDAAGTLYTDSPAAIRTTPTSKAFRTLTMAEGTSITVNGAISLGGRYFAAGGGQQGRPIGDYGYIKMANNSSITVKSGGNLYAWGFISGSGSILAESGATVYEFYQIADFRGGSASSGMGNNVFPFSQYFVQNIEVPLTLNAGANEKVFSGVYAMSTTYTTAISFIGDNGMFKVVSGSFTKDYDEKTDRLILTVNGEAELNTLALKLAGMSVNSANYVLPITNNISINIQSGKVTINQDTALLAGVEVSIADGADLTVSNGKNVYVYDSDEWNSDKLAELEATINSEYAAAYAEAKSKGYSDAEAAIQAQTAAVNKALDNATRITVYLYRSDEANFDFNDATGGSGVLAWNRDVPGSDYSGDDDIYYLTATGATGEAAYVFAVDMSKVPIPEKLTGLLYMLPGGDQEGRTAWDFLLQLAERISPLTTVTITLDFPEGFTADISELRLANEYFTLTSKDIVGNRLTVVCNFIEQSEPINPATANPLCVLSGLKLIPTDAAAWDANGLLNCTVSGSLSYDIYAHFHVLKTLAQQEEYQIQYGLYPYDNSENIAGDYGAHFTSDITDFADHCNLMKLNNKEGWSRANGVWSYYENGVALTGVHKLPSHSAEEDGEYWYDFGDTGTCRDKLTGIFEKDGARYYARMGVLTSGWQSIVADDGESYFYYFDKSDYTMYTGVRTVAGLTYTFNDDGQLVRGAFRTDANGTKYFVAGESWFRRFVTLDEGTYWLDVNGYVAYGNAHTVTDNVKDVTWYHFDENTGLMTGLCNGFFEYQGERYYCDENGKVFYGIIKTENGIVYSATRGKLYVNMSCYVDSTTAAKGCTLETGKYWCDENGFIVGNGFATIEGSTYYFVDYVRTKGFTKIDDAYYLFNAGSGKMYKDANMWVPANSYGIEAGMHYFEADGRMFVPNIETGVRKIVNENGKLYFTVDGVKLTNCLCELDGEYYFAQYSGELAVNTTVYVTTDDLSGNGWYGFDAEGKLIRNGFINAADGYTYYYSDGVRAKGFTKIDGAYYLFNAGSGKMYKDANMWVPANSYGIEAGMHYFEADGRMFVPNIETGVRKIVNENGKLYFTVDGVKLTNCLCELDGEYYFAQYSGELAVNTTVYVTTDDLSGNGWYGFDAEGKLIRNGFINAADGYTYYYSDGVRAKGFTKIDDAYYLFNAGSGKMAKDANMWVPANSYGVEAGMHYFDANGIMADV